MQDIVGTTTACSSTYLLLVQLINSLQVGPRVQFNVISLSSFGPGRFGGVMGFIVIFTIVLLLFLALAGGGSNPAGKSLTFN